MKLLKNQIISFILIISLVFSLVAVTYAWIARRFNPSIEGSNLNIQSTGAFNITFTSAQEAESTADLHRLIEIEDFIFKQISSQNGKDFYYVDFDDEDSSLPITRKLDRILLPSNEIQSLGLLSFKFALSLDDNYEGTRYVFFHPETGVSEDDNSDIEYSKAFRISFTVDKSGTETTYIFGEEAGICFNALTEADKDKTILLDDNPMSVNYGKISFTDGGTPGADQVIHSYSEYNGGYQASYDENWVLDSNKLDQNKVLFTMDGNNPMIWIDCNIWLEGADPNTILSINSLAIDIMIKFDSIGII